MSNHGKESPRGFTLDHTIPKSQFASCTEYATRKLAHQSQVLDPWFTDKTEETKMVTRALALAVT